MRASSPSPGPGARASGRSSPGPGAGGTSSTQVPSWPALAHKARLLFAQWDAAAAAARRALGVADHVRTRLGLLLLVGEQEQDANDNPNNNPWSACGQALKSNTAIRNRVIDRHLRDVEEELRGAAAAREAMAEAARGLGRLATAAATGAAALSPSALRALAQQLAPGPAPLEVAESVQDLWRACAAENQLHEAAAARCALPAVDGAGDRGGSGAAAAWAAALSLLEAEVNLADHRARFEAFFDRIRQAWPS